MKIAFAGTPEFAATALEALSEAGFDIPLVLTQPDRPAGRGMRLQHSAVKQLATKYGIPVLQPVSLRRNGVHREAAEEAFDSLDRAKPDVMVVVAYGLILPPEFLQIPTLGCLNIHASLLPRWRGAAPIQRAIEAGDKKTGITIMQMDDGLDTGPILAQEELPILPGDTASSMHDKLAILGGNTICCALNALKKGTLKSQPQDENQANYAPKIMKEEAPLDFLLPAEMIVNKIRAFNPFPGSQANLGDTPLKIWKAEAMPETTGAIPGQIIAANTEHGILVACGNGTLRITEIQKPGSKRLPATEFIKGFSLDNGHFS